MNTVNYLLNSNHIKEEFAYLLGVDSCEIGIQMSYTIMPDDFKCLITFRCALLELGICVRDLELKLDQFSKKFIEPAVLQLQGFK